MGVNAGGVGALLSVVVDGQQSDVSFGLLDSRENRPTLPTSPFRMGSIAKTVMATALRSLLDQHDRSLDEPVEVLLPGTVPRKLGDQPITWRHVLTHRSGIDGTYWQGFGDDSDAIKTYAAHVPDLPTTFPAGASCAYSNSGYVLAGRAIEVLSKRPYEAAVDDVLVRPLGLSRTTFELQPPTGAANGHHGMGSNARPAEVPIGMRALGPAGSTAFSTASDLLTDPARIITFEDLDRFGTLLHCGPFVARRARLT